LGKRGNLRILTGLPAAQVEDPVVLHGRAARKNDVKTLGYTDAEMRRVITSRGMGANWNVNGTD
jgi:hypothetical protein